MSILDSRKIVITGGVGFVGSSLAVALRQRYPNQEIVVFDNLKRRAAYLNLDRLIENSITFMHGDIRCADDLRELGEYSLLLDCSAEASVHASKQNTQYVLNTNLVGTIGLLEAAREQNAAFLLLSTSRVFPIEAINELPYTEGSTRYLWGDSSQTGFSQSGINEDFSLDGARSFYGTSKLCCELLMKEYVAETGLRCLTNRCGLIAGPGQMGVASQGIVAFWVLSHRFNRSLRYIGFNGQGKQVRDVLHVDDLADLVIKQIERPEVWQGRTYNVAGGIENSTSLRELTTTCENVTGNKLDIGCEPTTSDVDVRILILNSDRARHEFDWQPKRDVAQIVSDIDQWISNEGAKLQNALSQ